MKTLQRLFFWDFPRTSWQWDIIVTLILAFIFLTPRDVFRDQPRGASIQILQQGFLIEPKLLANVPAADQPHEAEELVNKKFKFKIHATITHVEAVRDEAEGEITGYMAYAKP
jgi:hypothetical protein